MPICWVKRSSASVTAPSGNAQGSIGSSGETRNSAGSAIAAPAFGVVKNRLANPRRDNLAEKGHPHDFAVAGAAVLDQCQGKAAADACPEIARGDMPDHPRVKPGGRRRRAIPRRDELCTFR